VLATRSQDAELGAFIAALFIARIPLLLFQAVQAALLPKLAGLLGHGHIREFRAGLKRLVVIVVVMSIAGVVLAAFVGPFIGRVLFGEKFTISGAGLAALTAGCCLVVIALTLAQALIALQRYALTAMAWLAGVAAFVALMVVLDVDVFSRAEIAFVVGGGIAVAWMSVASLVWAKPDDADSMHHHLPQLPGAGKCLRRFLPCRVSERGLRRDDCRRHRSRS
jgi:O-antigen/teichoic acid export membrane protein